MKNSWVCERLKIWYDSDEGGIDGRGSVRKKKLCSFRWRRKGIISQRDYTMLQEMEITSERVIKNLTNVSNSMNNNETLRYNEEFDYSFDRDQVEKIVVVVVPIFFGMIGILGLVGNSLVVIVVAANPTMRSTTNILIINLAVADLLFVILCIPFTATDFVLPFWPFGNFWCKMVQYLIIVTAYASVYTLVLMSLDRWVK